MKTIFKILALLFLFAPFSHGEIKKALRYRQNIDGNEYIYSVDEGSFVSANPGCRGFIVERLEHDLPNELKMKIKLLWDVSATFDGDQVRRKSKPWWGRTYIFKYEDGDVLSIEEVGKLLVVTKDE